MSQILKTKTFIWSVVYFFYAKNPCSIAVRPLLRGHTISDSKSIVLEKKSDILLGGVLTSKLSCTIIPSHFPLAIINYLRHPSISKGGAIKYETTYWDAAKATFTPPLPVLDSSTFPKSPLRNWIQRQNAAEIAAALVQFMEMCTKLCLATVHTQKTWAGGEPIKN